MEGYYTRYLVGNCVYCKFRFKPAGPVARVLVLAANFAQREKIAVILCSRLHNIPSERMFQSAVNWFVWYRDVSFYFGKILALLCRISCLSFEFHYAYILAKIAFTVVTFEIEPTIYVQHLVKIDFLKCSNTKIYSITVKKVIAIIIANL